MSNGTLPPDLLPQILDALQALNRRFDDVLGGFGERMDAMDARLDRLEAQCGDQEPSATPPSPVEPIGPPPPPRADVLSVSWDPVSGQRRFGLLTPDEAGHPVVKGIPGDDGAQRASTSWVLGLALDLWTLEQLSPLVLADVLSPEQQENIAALQRAGQRGILMVAHFLWIYVLDRSSAYAPGAPRDKLQPQHPMETFIQWVSNANQDTASSRIAALFRLARKDLRVKLGMFAKECYVLDSSFRKRITDDLAAQPSAVTVGDKRWTPICELLGMVSNLDRLALPYLTEPVPAAAQLHLVAQLEQLTVSDPANLAALLWARHLLPGAVGNGLSPAVCWLLWDGYDVRHGQFAKARDVGQALLVQKDTPNPPPFRANWDVVEQVTPLFGVLAQALQCAPVYHILTPHERRALVCIHNAASRIASGISQSWHGIPANWQKWNVDGLPLEHARGGGALLATFCDHTLAGNFSWYRREPPAHAFQRWRRATH